jgi:hypothetical protein
MFFHYKPVVLGYPNHGNPIWFCLEIGWFDGFPDSNFNFPRGRLNHLMVNFPIWVNLIKESNILQFNIILKLYIICCFVMHTIIDNKNYDVCMFACIYTFMLYIYMWLYIPFCWLKASLTGCRTNGLTSTSAAADLCHCAALGSWGDFSSEPQRQFPNDTVAIPLMVLCSIRCKWSVLLNIYIIYMYVCMYIFTH